jgi:hypothetical protein
MDIFGDGPGRGGEQGPGCGEVKAEGHGKHLEEEPTTARPRHLRDDGLEHSFFGLLGAG